MRVEGLELAVEVDPAVDRIGEAREAGADVLVGAAPPDVELVGFLQVGEPQPGAVEGFLGHLLAVELDLVQRAGREVDEGGGARSPAEEVDGRVAAEGLFTHG